MPKKVRFFFKRSPKVEFATGKRPIIIPFRIGSLFLLILMIFVSTLLFLRSDLFQIAQIQVGQIPACATEEGIKLTAEAVGASIIFFDTGKASKKIGEKFYCISEVKITKKYPNKLTIATFERIPVAALVQIESQPQLSIATISAIPATDSAFLATTFPLFALDKEGVIFTKLATNSALPRLFFASDLPIGAKISDKEILWLLKFLGKAAEFNLNFSQFVKTSENLIVGQTGDGIKLIMSANFEPEKIASSLQAILRQAKIEGVNFKILDLRFEKPILK